jgi:hypothetical protein
MLKFRFNRALAPLLFVVAAPLAGCSGDETSDDEGAAGATGSECEIDHGPVDPTALIDDLEDGNGALPAISTRNGSWWISTDTSGGIIEPPAEAAPPAERILGGRCESEYAMRVTGSGFTEWGAVLTAGFRYTTEVASIDASAYRGVTFWARVGEDHTSPVRVQFQDTSSEPNGGVCNPESTGTDQCYDGWGTALTTIGTEWQQFRIAFSTLGQRGFGYAGEAIDTSNLYTIEWNLEQNSTYNLWIDDVWFYE